MVATSVLVYLFSMMKLHSLTFNEHSVWIALNSRVLNNSLQATSIIWAMNYRYVYCSIFCQNIFARDCINLLKMLPWFANIETSLKLVLNQLAFLIVQQISHVSDHAISKHKMIIWLVLLKFRKHCMIIYLLLNLSLIWNWFTEQKFMEKGNFFPRFIHKKSIKCYEWFDEST